MIFSIINQKGGVGKTTTVLNLGHGLANEGYSVLLIDTDAQANLTQCCNVMEEQDNNLFTLMKRAAAKEPIKAVDTICKVTENLHLIPATKDLSEADVAFSTANRREYLMQKVVADVQDQYDIILIDCPPAFNFLVKNVLVISRYVVIPVLAEFLPVKGIELFLDRVRGFAEEMEVNLDVGGILFCQYNPESRTRLSKELYELVKNQLGAAVFETTIRRNISISEAQAERKSIFEYAGDSNGANDYRELTKEFVTRFAS